MDIMTCCVGSTELGLSVAFVCFPVFSSQITPSSDSDSDAHLKLPDSATEILLLLRKKSEDHDEL